MLRTITWDLEFGRAVGDIPHLNQKCKLCLDTSVNYVVGQDTSQRTNFMYYFGLCLNQSLQHLDELIDVLR